MSQKQFHDYKAWIVFLYFVVFSGLPLPVLDAHPTSDAATHAAPYLWSHLNNTPAAEHEDVGDSELHIHWICLMVSAPAEMSPNCGTSLERLGLDVESTCLSYQPFLTESQTYLSEAVVSDFRSLRCCVPLFGLSSKPSTLSRLLI